MLKRSKILITTLLLLLGGVTLNAQKNSDKLKQQERELKKKIKETNELISKKKQDERLTLLELAIVKEQLAAQEELLVNMSNQVRRINQDIAENESVIKSLKLDLVKMKKQYGKMLMYAYKHRNKNHLLLFIFSSKNFNQAFSRVKYIKQFSEYKVEKLKMIKSTQLSLEKKQLQLEQKRSEKEGLVKQKNEEKEIFEQNKEKQQRALSEVKQQEAELTKELKKQVQQQISLQEKINKAINDEEYNDYVEKGDKEFKKENYDNAIAYYEKALTVYKSDKKAKEKIADAKEKKKKKAGTNTTPETKPDDKKTVDPDETPESILETTNFENAKGLLPWPVEKGNITLGFGPQPHPVVKGISINNNGVDIASNAGAKVRAVFEGKVTKVLVFDGGGKTIIVNHGKYRTVYANLKESYVKEGETITKKQNIGVLYSEGDALTELHFEVRFGAVKQNPADWLTKK